LILWFNIPYSFKRFSTADKQIKFNSVVLCAFSVFLCVTILKITQRATEKAQRATEDFQVSSERNRVKIK
jgi:glycopeptide antibiotics resistance protein